MASIVGAPCVSSFGIARAQRANAGSASRCARVSRQLLVTRATPQTASEKSAIETAIDNARQTCEGDNTGACANAWDEVEEISADLAKKRETKKKSDPLDDYCEDNPDADECRVYED